MTVADLSWKQKLMPTVHGRVSCSKEKASFTGLTELVRTKVRSKADLVDSATMTPHWLDISPMNVSYEVTSTTLVYRNDRK